MIASTALRAPGWFAWIALAVLWFIAAGVYPLMEPDEARYAEIPREMAASGDWLTPRLGDLKYFEKPPLQYWATAALYEGFGVKEWTARAWPLGLAFLCLPLAFVRAARRYGVRAGLTALAVLASSPFFLVMGHLNLLDAGLAFWLTATVFAFTFAQESPLGSRGERNGMLCAWLAAALAVLSKGIVVPVLAGLTLITYSALYRDWQPWRRLRLLAGLPLFLLVTVPWFVAVSLENPEFLRFFFLHEHFERFLTTVHKRAEPVWFFLPILVFAMLPWIWDLPGALRQAWRERSGEPRFKPLGVLLAYCAVVFVFFSVSQSKLLSYVLPMVPALAVLVGVYVAERPAALRRAAWISATIVAMTAGGIVIYTFHRYAAVPLPLGLFSLAALSVAVLAAFRIESSGVRHGDAYWLAAACILAWQCLMAAYGTPPLERSARSLVASIRPQIGASTALYNVGQYRQSVPVYLGRTVILVDYQGELEFGQQQEPGRNAATLGQFKTQWNASPDAVAFIRPAHWEKLAHKGLPGRVIGSDRFSIVVSRR